MAVPMRLPQCPEPGHGEMKLRSLDKQTYEQKYCGVWYDCQYPGCNNSVLFMSKELMKGE